MSTTESVIARDETAALAIAELLIRCRGAEFTYTPLPDDQHRFTFKAGEGTRAAILASVGGAA